VGEEAPKRKGSAPCSIRRQHEFCFLSFAPLSGNADAEMLKPDIPRQIVLRALAAISSLASRPQLPAVADVGPISSVPLSLCGGAYCVTYKIDGQLFRAVVDTGSPFVLVDGTCDAGGRSVWGCYRGRARPSGLPDTDELYGGEDVGVQWNVGRFELADGLAVNNATFGVVRSYVGKGGGGAVFLGFVKHRLPRIRPTLLEQTHVASLRFDFPGRTLSLSPSSLISPTTDAVRVLDLRPRGAPVANYALRISRLVVNGQAIPLGRPAVAVIDSGTTGTGQSAYPHRLAHAARPLRLLLAVSRRAHPAPGSPVPKPRCFGFQVFPSAINSSTRASSLPSGARRALNSRRSEAPLPSSRPRSSAAAVHCPACGRSTLPRRSLTSSRSS
jgi:hypothetical protein